MGGMYNAVLGDGAEMDRAYALSRVLGLRRRDFGRLRDAWVEAHGDTCVLAFYTRNGGGNRPDYAHVTTALQASPYYLSDEDDSFDSTYATYRFTFPEKVPAVFVEAGVTQEVWDEIHKHFMTLAHPGKVDMSAVWKQAIDKVQAEGMPPEMMERIAQNVKIIIPNVDSPPSTP